MFHIYLCAQHPASVREFSVPHAGKEVGIFLNASVPERAVCAGGGYGAPGLSDFLLILVIYVSQSFGNEPVCPVVQLFKIVRGIKLIGPLEPQPVDVFFNGIYVFHFFLYGVGVIKTEVCCSVVFQTQTKIQANAFGMSYMQVTVRFRREPGNNRCVFALRQIRFNNFLNKIQRTFCRDLCLFRIHFLEILNLQY